MLDLFAGLGGASQAMKDRGWKVITVEIDPCFHPDIIADITTFHYYGPTPDLIWASPECTEFTRASLPASWACNKNGKPDPDMAQVEAAIRIIEEVKPRWWIIENVRGAVPYFKPRLGPPAKRSGSRYLWGCFPPFDCRPEYGKEKIGPCENRHNIRSVIPYQLSLALCLSIEQHKTII